MKMDRRSFFKMAGGIVATSLALGEGQAAAMRVSPLCCLFLLSRTLIAQRGVEVSSRGGRSI